MTGMAGSQALSLGSRPGAASRRTGDGTRSKCGVGPQDRWLWEGGLGRRLGRSMIVVVLVPVVVLIPMRPLDLPRTNQLHRPLERFERHLRAPAAQREAEPLALSRFPQRHRKRRLELAAEGADRDRRARAFRHRQGHITVV